MYQSILLGITTQLKQEALLPVEQEELLNSYQLYQE